ncbi:MAG: hypothetical protein FP814_05645 [Desulfobacterium sp.]|nr:hypothetical protein [Desulfobacterium sp.]MBU3948342.1 VanZ family protein [Pseudomonadota bacterium]MBU4034888.1 VanZ family protein [Pseudomonadota bacterium]
MKYFIKYILQPLNDINYKLLRNICLAVILAIVLAGLWPFNFFPKNKVKWVQNISGISFYGQGMVISSGQFKGKNESLFPDRSISMELRLKPLNESGYLPHIVNLYDGKLPGVVVVGQWRSHLIILCRTNYPAQFEHGKPYKEIGLRNVLLKNQDVFITIVSDKKGSAIYVNGIPAKFYPGFQLLSEYIDESFYIIIGNSPEGQSFWNGEFMGLAIYNTALKPEQIAKNYQSWMQGKYELLKRNPGIICFYPFSEKKGSIIHNYVDSGYPLMIPEIFKPIKRIFLEPPWRENKWNLSFIQDVIINFFGFIPFGFFMSAFFVKKRRLGLNANINIIYFIIIIVGFAFSLSIEFIQAYLPTRFSQLSDLILNTFGTAAGVFMAHAFMRFKVKG